MFYLGSGCFKMAQDEASWGPSGPQEAPPWDPQNALKGWDKSAPTAFLTVFLRLKCASSYLKAKFCDDARCYLYHADVHFILYFTHQDASPVRCFCRCFRLRKGILSLRRFRIAQDRPQEVHDTYSGNYHEDFIPPKLGVSQNPRKKTRILHDLLFVLVTSHYTRLSSL